MASDADLIGRSLDGDVDAFVEVVERHEAAVGSYLVRRVGRDAAEDLLGEVWVAAFESRRSYDRSYDDARPWLYGVAIESLAPLLAVPAGRGPGRGRAGLATGWDPWSAVDLGMDARAVLRSALMRLKPEEREVLRLVAWEDLTAADAARALGIPAGTARRLLSQARTALRDAPGVSALLKDRNSAKERHR